MKISIPEKPEDFPGQERVTLRPETHRLVLAALAGALWPPIPVTLLIWPPRHWLTSLEVDPRFVAGFAHELREKAQKLRRRPLSVLDRIE